METAIRWSQNSTDADQRFLFVDVVGRSLKLCRVRSWKGNDIDYDVITTHSKVPAFRAFDWSPTNEALVAVGQSSGEATVLRIGDVSQDTFSLPIRNQRYCNAVAFSAHGLLAAGLDKVRNDFCLNIWDLNQRIPAANSRGFSGDRQNVDPSRKLASSEPITSIKFFPSSPEELVAGVKGQFVRIYDLRQPPGNPSLQFATRCVHNLAIDAIDENYVASCYPANDATICVWDKRASSRLSPATFGSFNQTDSGQPSAALELRNVTDSQGAIWSLRFAKTKRGCLGMLSSTGHFKNYDIGKDFISEDAKVTMDQMGHDWPSKYPEQIYTKTVQDIHQPFYHRTRGRAEKTRIVSFDFMTSLASKHATNALTLSGDRHVRVIPLSRAPFPRDISNTGVFVRTFPSRQLGISEGTSDLRASTQAQHGPIPTRSSAVIQERIASERPLSSGQLHEYLLQPRAEGNLDGALSTLNVRRLRCEAGYRFDCAKNIKVSANDKWLQSFWAWVGRARANAESGDLIHDGVDLGYLGIHAIWMDDIGRNEHTRRLALNSHKSIDLAKITQGVVKKLSIPSGKGYDSNFPAHRALCLHTCGLAGSYEDLESSVNKLVSENKHTKAAALAIFANEPKLAHRALRQNDATQAHKMLAMAIVGAASGNADEDWEETCASLAEELTDPYARAILARVSKGDWTAVIEETTLPLKYRVGVALRWLPDRALTAYLGKVTREAIRNGDLEGIVLTGLSHLSVELFQNYIRKFHDLQTAVLALTFTVPRYIDDEVHVRRFDSWRATYREQMNAWGLKIDRVRFDVESRRLAVTWDGRPLVQPAKAQVSLVCSYCNRETNREDYGHPPSDSTTNNTNTPNPPASSAGPGDSGDVANNSTVSVSKTYRTDYNPLDIRSAEAAAIGTVCPKCRKHLPRCSICLMWLGMPDPSYIRSGAHLSNNMTASMSTTATGGASSQLQLNGSGSGSSNDRQPNKKKTKEEQQADAMQKFMTFCANCGHGYHADHAREWFVRHRVCPVAECGCVCARD